MECRIPTAIDKSKNAPSFLVLAGAKFTIILLLGNSKFEFFIAVFTRSLLSLMLVSGRPTISKKGIPSVQRLFELQLKNRRGRVVTYFLQ
jgi:hypothetical protein